MSEKILYGVIIKKNTKTFKVTVNKKIKNKKYKKVVNKKKNYIADKDDNIENIEVRDKVCIIESIPKSKSKKWKIIKINK